MLGCSKSTDRHPRDYRDRAAGSVAGRGAVGDATYAAGGAALADTAVVEPVGAGAGAGAGVAGASGGLDAVGERVGAGAGAEAVSAVVGAVVGVGDGECVGDAVVVGAAQPCFAW